MSTTLNDDLKNENKQKFIPVSAQKRIAFDIKDILRNPLTNEGIYYKHDENDLTTGYAMIVGPEDSVYQYGYLFFKFQFPIDYPYSPPKVSYIPFSTSVRYHPNLYRNGKVCLSIINTWNGPSWSSTQSLRSILITLQSILDDKPLLHEPGSFSNDTIKKYNEIITYTTFSKIIEFFLKGVKYIKTLNIVNKFIEEMIAEFKKNKGQIENALLKNVCDIKVVFDKIYSTSVSINYQVLINDFYLIDDIKIENTESENTESENTKSENTESDSEKNENNENNENDKN